MTEINKGLILLLELIIAVSAILFLAGLYVGIFGSSAIPITSETGIVSGAVLILISGFMLAFYSSKEDAAKDAIA
ncbi:hypothetical protein LJC08_02285 [Methanimicrococcus sp. OttesenSCG-928-J09]|nr:hypothetical protein [Methanimicrococcus sp. OttesenSCG-928-J09]